MVIACLGDSLTEGDYGIYGKRGIKNVHEKNYPYFLQKLTGATVKNYGVCGYTATAYLKHYQNGMAPVKDADIILIMLGTNGGLDKDKNCAGNEDFRSLLRLIKDDAPNAEIFLLTPPHVTENSDYSNCGYKDRIINAVPVVKMLAKEFGTRLIDVNAYDEFCAENEYLYQPNDGLHFTEIGYKVLAEFIFNAIKEFI